jgi:hypothetical protein
MLMRSHAHQTEKSLTPPWKSGDWLNFIDCVAVSTQALCTINHETCSFFPNDAQQFAIWAHAQWVPNKKSSEAYKRNPDGIYKILVLGEIS